MPTEDSSVIRRRRVCVACNFRFTTFARGARAILDADRNLYRERHAAILRRIFRRRGILNKGLNHRELRSVRAVIIRHGSPVFRGIIRNQERRGFALLGSGAYRLAPVVTDTGSSITVNVTGTKVFWNWRRLLSCTMRSSSAMYRSGSPDSGVNSVISAAT